MSTQLNYCSLSFLLANKHVSLKPLIQISENKMPSQPSIFLFDTSSVAAQDNMKFDQLALTHSHSNISSLSSSLLLQDAHPQLSRNKCDNLNNEKNSFIFPSKC